MRVFRFAIALASIFLLMHKPLWACSVCRCGDQSFFLNNARQLSSGRFLFAVEHFNTRKTALMSPHHEEGPMQALEKFSAPLRMQHGDELEAQVQNTLQFNLKYGLTKRVMLMASIPYAFNRIAMTEGAETAKGLGDPEVMALARLLEFANGAWSLQGTAGARIPLGASDQKDEAGVRLEQHLQTGSGAWAGVFGVQFIKASGNLPVFFGASYQSNGTNDHDFAYGNIFRFNVAAQRAIAGSFDLIAEVNGRVADYDTEGAETDANSGGTVVYFSPGVRVRFGSLFSLRSQVQIPVAENLHGEQNEKVNVRTGLVWEF